MDSESTDGRTRLLAAAEAEVAEAPLGPGQVSLRAIARRAGLSHNAAQHHFGDRAGLLTALAVDGFDRLGEAMAAATETRGVDDPLLAIGQAYLKFGLARPNLLDLMFRPELVRAEDADLIRAKGATFGALQAAVAEDEGRDPSLVATPAEDPGPPAALRAWAYVHGLVVLARVGALSPPGSAPDPETSALVARRLMGVTDEPG